VEEVEVKGGKGRASQSGTGGTNSPLASMARQLELLERATHYRETKEVRMLGL
jgi:hypothetical protein